MTGVVKYDNTNTFEKIKLVQEDGFLIDLVSRFIEIKESYPMATFQVNCFVSESKCSIGEAKEKWLYKLSGGIVAEFEVDSYSYSSWTSGTDYNTNFSIGKHNIFSELRQSENKFLIIEINIKTPTP